MAVTTEMLSNLLSAGGIRHHVDGDEDVIRIAVVTGRYRNLRSERLAILEVAPVGDGTRCRVSLGRAFAPDQDLAEACLTLCRIGAGVPLVRVECDPTGRTLGLAAELSIEDATLTGRQLFAAIDQVVEAAEAGQTALATLAEPPRRRGTSGRRRAA